MALFFRKPQGPVLKVTRIDMHWDVEDPFLFVSHHEDDYPHGNRQQAPPLEEIRGRDLGRDYEKRMGFRMFNGKVVPGFPMHAHWGYETVTLAQKGYVDHFDAEGNQGRFGFGDVQWVCASSKYMHNEMYPLANQEDRNPNDITQIMINLPLEMKNGDNFVNTVWREDVPVVGGEGWSAQVICGEFGGRRAVSPSTTSWTHGDSMVRMLRIEMEPNAVFKLDPVPKDVNRNLYLVSGEKADFSGNTVEAGNRVKMDPAIEAAVTNGDAPAVLWVLEGRPIGQRMVSFGPVTLASDKEVRRALDDIRKNEFAEWPWDVIDKAQPLGTGRFIRYSDGTEHRPSD